MRCLGREWCGQVDGIAPYYLGRVDGENNRFSPSRPLIPQPARRARAPQAS